MLNLKKEKPFIRFIFFCQLGIAFLALILLLFGFIYRYSNVNFYHVITFAIIIFLSLILISLFACVLVLYNIYNGKVSLNILNKPLMFVVKIAFLTLEMLANIFKINKENLKTVYISINNMFIEKLNIKYNGNDVLILLPHCLQNSNCKERITGESLNCRLCGGCDLSDIIKLSQKYKTNIIVVTGGTAARTYIKKIRPKFIISVACERDLYSGIMDVKTIPIIGVLNSRPNGPCNFTKVDINEIENCLKKVIKEG